MTSEGAPILDTISALRSDRDALQDIINAFAIADWQRKHGDQFVGQVPEELIQRARSVYNTTRR